LSQDNTTSDGSTVTPPAAGTNPPAGGGNAGQQPDLAALFKTLASALSEMDTALQPFDTPMSDADLRSTFYINRGRDPYVEAGKLHLDAHGADYLAAKNWTPSTRLTR
jgi:hypothetical protein